MVVISHFKLYPALFPLKWFICIPNISAVRGNVVFETLHDFYRTAIIQNERDLATSRKEEYAEEACLCPLKSKEGSLIPHLHFV